MEQLNDIYENQEPQIDFFGAIDKYSVATKKLIIINTIIPLMNLRRKTVNNIPSDEINIKLNAPGESEKPGEKIELWESLMKNINVEGITPKIAHELADIAYYGLQPNCKENDRLDNLVKTGNIELMFYGLNIIDIMTTFCIIKYSTRLTHGDVSNYKEIEFNVLQKYLSLHPNLMSIWIQPSTENTRVFHSTS